MLYRAIYSRHGTRAPAVRFLSGPSPISGLIGDKTSPVECLILAPRCQFQPSGHLRGSAIGLPVAVTVRANGHHPDPIGRGGLLRDRRGGRLGSAPPVYGLAGADIGPERLCVAVACTNIRAMSD